MEQESKVVGFTEKPSIVEFDPQKSYVWQPDQIFGLAGGELHALKQILNALCQPAEAQRAIAAYEALKLIDGIIQKNVENGNIKEAPASEPEDIK